MSGSTVTGGAGGTTVTGGSGTTTATPTYNYFVVQPGFGFPIGTTISDATTIASFGGISPSWAVRIDPMTTGN